MSPKKIVITGGPGTGKTAIIDEIEKKGLLCFHEISRSVTLDARVQGIPQLFVADPLLFSKKILEGRIQQFKEAVLTGEEFVFLDRGLPDVPAYMDSVGQAYGTGFEEACRNFRYDMVFLLPPWKAIYTVDNERHEDFEEAIEIHGFLERAYMHYGYCPIETPIGTVGDRIDFILQKLKTGK